MHIWIELPIATLTHPYASSTQKGESEREKRIESVLRNHQQQKHLSYLFLCKRTLFSSAIALHSLIK